MAADDLGAKDALGRRVNDRRRDDERQQHRRDGDAARLSGVAAQRGPPPR
jgi:hypothetical protein